MKRPLLVFMAILGIILSMNASPFIANKMYRVEKKEMSFYKTEDIGPKRKALGSLHRGDTLLASPDLQTYLDGKEGEMLDLVPVMYQGNKVYVEYRHLEPIKSSSTDTISAMRYDRPMSETALQRSMYPIQDWAINHTPIDSHDWLWVFIGLLVAGLVSFIVGIKLTNRYKNLAFAVSAVLMILITIAEVWHMTAVSSPMWFISPVYVSWGKAILNLILLAIAIATQGFMFIDICFTWLEKDAKSGDKDDDSIILVGVNDDSDDKSERLNGIIAFAPLALAVVIAIMFVIDMFSGNEWGLNTYSYVVAVLILPMLIGEIKILINKRFVAAVLFPIFYVVFGAGFILQVAILGYLIIILAILIALLVFGLMAAGSVIAGIFSSKMEGKLPDGTAVTGYKGLDGKFHADNGQTYDFR